MRWAWTLVETKRGMAEAGEHRGGRKSQRGGGEGAPARKVRASRTERGEHWQAPREAGAAGRKTKGHGVAERLARDGRVRRGGPRESAQSRAAGGGRAAVLLLILRGFALSESAFGDTGTKAVHHITARPGGSLRSRRLIRGERVGRRGGREADCQAGARAPRSDPRREEGAGLRARLWGGLGARGADPLCRALLNNAKETGQASFHRRSEARLLPVFCNRPF